MSATGKVNLTQFRGVSKLRPGDQLLAIATNAAPNTVQWPDQ